MAKKFKRSSLILGQVAQPATTPTLAGFFRNVAAGRRGAVEDIGEDVEKKTRGLTKDLGLTETVDDKTGEVSTGMGDKFRATVDTSGGTVYSGAPPPPTSTESATTTQPSSADSKNTFTLLGGKTVTIPDKNDPKYKDNPQGWLDAVNKALTDLGSNIQEWKDSGKEAEEFLNELLAKIREEAQGAIKDVNERITVGNLGKRGEQSEIEKEAENYQNIIANEPGTSNIAALANLSKFYDMSKYGALESGLRQGELALSRQDMIREKEAMDTAESARSAAVRDYGEQSKRLVGELEEGLTEQEKEQRKNLADYYKTGEEELTGQKTTLEENKTSAEKAVVAKERQPYLDKVDTLNKELRNAEYKTSITPKPISELKRKIPEFGAMLQEVRDSFNGHYDFLGNIMDAYLTGDLSRAKEAVEWARGRSGFKGWTYHGVLPAHSDFMRTLDEMWSKGESGNFDNLIWGMSKLLDIARDNFGDNKGLSGAKGGTSKLFQWRDKFEENARNEYNNKLSELDSANTELATFDANNREYL